MCLAASAGGKGLFSAPGAGRRPTNRKRMTRLITTTQSLGGNFAKHVDHSRLEGSGQLTWLPERVANLFLCAQARKMPKSSFFLGSCWYFWRAQGVRAGARLSLAGLHRLSTVAEGPAAGLDGDGYQ